jgi:hypothetical protein
MKSQSVQEHILLHIHLQIIAYPHKKNWHLLSVNPKTYKAQVIHKEHDQALKCHNLSQMEEGLIHRNWHCVD